MIDRTLYVYTGSQKLVPFDCKDLLCEIVYDVNVYFSPKKAKLGSYPGGGKPIETKVSPEFT